MKLIASAFIKAKKSFSPALKSSLNPHFKSKYADLAVCIEAVDDAFLENGIVMYQETFEDSLGVTVETVLLHESGEYLRCGKLHVPSAKNDPQGYGSALSYARRYSLITACGIAPEDDDGNAAAKKSEPAKPAVCNANQVSQMRILAEQVGADLPALFEWLSKKSGRTVNTFAEITAAEMPHVIKALESKKATA
jgi:hypothetical protein